MKRDSLCEQRKEEKKKVGIFNKKGAINSNLFVALYQVIFITHIEKGNSCFSFYKHENYKHDEAQIQPKCIYQITISLKI